MSTAVTDVESPLLFSVPFRYRWDASFSSEMNARTGPATSLKRFVGDRENLLLRYFSDRVAVDGDSIASQMDDADWPLVLFGPSGTGKSAIAMSVLAQDQRRGKQQALCWSAADFDRRIRLAYETDSLNEFRQRVQRCTGLVIDDVHQLATKPAAQRELMVLIDRMIESATPFIVTMNTSPLEQTGLVAGLASRLCSGLSLPVYPPGTVARREIVRDLCNVHQLQLTDDAIELIVDRLPVTVPRLNHLFHQLQAAIRADRTLDRKSPIAAIQLTRLFERNTADIDRMSKLISRMVATEFHVKRSDLKSSSRKQSVVLARGVAIYLHRTMLPISFEKIGSLFGGRDHSTVMHAYRKIKQLVDTGAAQDYALIQSVQQLSQQLAEQFAGHLQFN